MRQYKSYNSVGRGCGAYILVVIVGVVILLLCSLGSLVTTEYNNLTVTDKSYAGSEDGFIVWMEDSNGTQYEFSNNDEWLRGKFNSSTVQGNLKVGYTYDIKVTGWRIPLLSVYQNIIEYKLVDNKLVEKNN